jgi:hypothetical protein
MFLKTERDYEIKPEGFWAVFKSPETKTEKSDPFAILIHCQKKMGRDYVAGNLGSEFYVPWQPLAPGSNGYVAFNAFCKK